METNTRSGFTAKPENGYKVYAPCMGARHKDSALIGTCDGCGWPVAKTDKGRILNIIPNPMGPRRIACWAYSHECDPELLAAHQVVVAARIDSGEIVKGQTVTVVKGRKVPKGTTGIVSWIGEDGYGKARIGFRTEAGEMIFTAQSNVAVTLS